MVPMTLIGSLERWGDGLVLRLPPEEALKLGLRAGDAVRFRVEPFHDR